MYGIACYLCAFPIMASGHKVKTLQDTGKQHRQCLRRGARSALKPGGGSEQSRKQAPLQGLQFLSSGHVLSYTDKPDSSRSANFEREK